jgi:predicted Zn-dependent protease
MWSVKAHYHLGRAYEAIGDEDNARRSYEEFLAYWGNADTGIAEVADARKRIAINDKTAGH